MNPGLLVNFYFFSTCFQGMMYEMGFHINLNARKTDLESIAFRTLDFERILNNERNGILNNRT